MMRNIEIDPRLERLRIQIGYIDNLIERASDNLDNLYNMRNAGVSPYNFDERVENFGALIRELSLDKAQVEDEFDEMRAKLISQRAREDHDGW